MFALWTKLTSWIQEEKGASMVEYALLVVLIAIVALVAVRLAGTQVSVDLQRDRLRPQPKSQRLDEKGPASAGPFFISTQVFGGVRRYSGASQRRRPKEGLHACFVDQGN